MATITTKKYSVEITTILGTKITAADSAESKAGTLALRAFEAMETIVVEDVGYLTEIPFHAIDNVKVTETEDSAEYSDTVCQ